MTKRQQEKIKQLKTELETVLKSGEEAVQVAKDMKEHIQILNEELKKESAYSAKLESQIEDVKELLETQLHVVEINFDTYYKTDVDKLLADIKASVVTEPTLEAKKP